MSGQKFNNKYREPNIFANLELISSSSNPMSKFDVIYFKKISSDSIPRDGDWANSIEKKLLKIHVFPTPDSPIIITKKNKLVKSSSGSYNFSILYSSFFELVFFVLLSLFDKLNVLFLFSLMIFLISLSNLISFFNSFYYYYLFWY